MDTKEEIVTPEVVETPIVEEAPVEVVEETPAVETPVEVAPKILVSVPCPQCQGTGAINV